MTGSHRSDRARHSPTSRTRWGLRTRLAIAAIGLLVAVLTTVVGVHPSSPERLRADVAAGDATTVQAFGYRVPGVEGVETYATQEIRWRTGLITRSAQVDRQTPDGIGSDATTELRQIAPDLEVERREPVTSAALLYDVVVPWWLPLLAVGGWLSALIALVSGTEPWRLTRWGWAWSFFLVPPVGVLLFCLLSGPTPLVPRPRRARRIGGLGGFLLAVVLLVVIPGR